MSTTLRLLICRDRKSVGSVWSPYKAYVRVQAQATVVYACTGLIKHLLLRYLNYIRSGLWPSDPLNISCLMESTVYRFFYTYWSTINQFNHLTANFLTHNFLKFLCCMHTSNYFIHRVRNYYNNVCYVGFFFASLVVTCDYIIFWQNIFFCFRSNRFGTVAPVNVNCQGKKGKKGPFIGCLFCC